MRFSLTTFPMVRAALAAAVIALPGAALAGPQYIDGTGFAVSGFDVVAYRDLEQVPLGGDEPEGVIGSAAFTTEWNGETWAFSSAENLARFEADPEFYAPAYDGHCAFAAARGSKAPGNPNVWRIVDDVLYLNLTDRAQTLWERDIPGNLEQSEANWIELEPLPASTGSIPGFTSPGPDA